VTLGHMMLQEPGWRVPDRWQRPRLPQSRATRRESENGHDGVTDNKTHHARGDPTNSRPQLRRRPLQPSARRTQAGMEIHSPRHRHTVGRGCPRRDDSL